MARPKKRLSPQAVQVLVVCAAVLACAAIYLLVSSREEESRAIRIDAASPTPEKAAPTPSQTPVRGVRERVFISRLLDQGLSVEEGEGERDYTISFGEDAYALRLSLGDGYVLGFTLIIPVMQKPVISGKNPTEIEKRLLEAYEIAAAADHERIETLLAGLMDALAAQGYFPPATSLFWAGMATIAREEGSMIYEEANGYQFTASCRSGGNLTLAVAME